MIDAKKINALVDEILLCGQSAQKLFKEGAGKRAKMKPDRSPVTEADEAVEKRLRAFVASQFPDAGFIGEETGETNKQAKMRFIVDPIDGTRAFLRGMPTWSILVGIEVDGEPFVGIAHLPATDEIYIGVRGAGTTAGTASQSRTLKVSEIAALSDAAVCHGALAQFTQGRCENILPALSDATYTQRGFGDFAGYRALVEGQVDGVVDPDLKPWDMCAPAVIVREAGGQFTSLDGQETIYGGGAVASNGKIHGALVALCKGGGGLIERG